MGTSDLAALGDFVSPSQWASHHNVHVATAYRLIACGRLPYINVATGTKKATYRIRRDQEPDHPEDAAAGANEAAPAVGSSA